MIQEIDDQWLSFKDDSSSNEKEKKNGCVSLR